MTSDIRSLVFGLAFAATLLALPAGPASAQSVLALVNTTPITNFDVAQRVRIAQLTERRRLSNAAALQELIDDQVKLFEARRLGYRITDAGIEQEFEKLARNSGSTVSVFENNLRRAGIQPSAMRDKLRASSAWSVILRDLVRRGTQVSSAELEAAVAEEAKKRGEVIDYELLSVIFVVGTGQSPGERERAANAARGRFTNCETGAEAFRDLRDVVVRPPIVRSSESISPALAKVLAKTAVGRLTPAYRTDQGIEMVAVCARKTRDVSGSLRSEVAAALGEKKVSARAQEHLKELRKSVDIRRLR